LQLSPDPRQYLARFINNRRIARKQDFMAVYELNTGTMPHSELIVSAGGDTLAANIAIGRPTGAPGTFSDH
jgi:hypothetical protein